jgi:thioredoxin-dependent peroxiredoxin
MSLQEGDIAPAFELPASFGRTVGSAPLAGQPYVLYFYPKADTSGCTKEACAFQEALPQLGQIGLTVIGISRDPMKAIEKFADKYGLSFPLASDAEGKVSDAYGTWIEKSMYGRKYMGMDRATFLVGRDGRIARIWRKVKVTGHAAEVMKAAQALG